MRIVPTDDMAGKLYDGELHTKTEAKEWNLVFTGILDSVNLTIDTAITETTGNKNAAHIIEIGCRIFGCYVF